ncbi:hypothetical protein [Paucibacter sp. KCTC 42545]|uniref:hypothetical protein n=1 Tax=Paucibacter sp. KCTC 42545 TaxID=1768242 RepID=UPI000733A2F1|nr:hypothetical protein [Paucibacter sp. KCTC 42545]ALT79047.1 hypothetical protein AT984_19500 [Paucibacter sp. KCTC 42545]
MRTQSQLLAKELRPEMKVSSRSYWRDPKWYLDVQKVGFRDSVGRFNWGIDMGSGSTLLDPAWEELLEDCRVLVYSLVYDPRMTGAQDAFTVSTRFGTQLRKLLTWMAEFGYDHFGQLDSEASWEFYEHVLNSHRKAKAEVTPQSLQNDLQVLVTIHRHSLALQDAGARVIPEAPYNGEAPGKVADKAATAADGWIPPLPDEVALKILGTSFRWIEQPMDDVLALIALQQRVVPSNGTTVRGRPVETALASFVFSVLPGETEPWHPSLNTSLDVASPQASRELRKLVLHAGAACAVLVQGTTGMRISELAALRGGTDAETGLPSCVRIRPSKTGLNELFMVQSQVTKIYDGTVMEWVIGMRPAGSAYIPPAVRAIQRLDALFSPWRDAVTAPQLILTPAGVTTLGRTTGVSATLEQISTNMKRFVAAYCGLETLPDVLQTPSGSLDLRVYKTGEGFRTHQWRKTYALYALRTDSRMLPAISQHFKHMSMAMTEQGYIGNDPGLLDSIDSVRRQRTVAFLLQQASGTTVIAGGMADLVREHRQRLKDVVGDAKGTDAYLLMEEWVVQGDVRIWFAEHGKCFMSLTPGSARCHSIAKTDPWLMRHPNYANRTASVCGGCKCFAVDGEHVEFWKERYQRNSAVLAAAGADRSAGYKVAQERVRQSESILRTLGAQVNEVGVDE